MLRTGMAGESVAVNRLLRENGSIRFWSRSSQGGGVAVSIGRVGKTEDDRLTSDSSLRLQILGPLRLWRNDHELDVGPRQQAQVLAILLAREGRPTSTGELIDLIWPDGSPTSALNVIHKYVGMLRRLLEPTLATREAGSYLLRRGESYIFVAGRAALDLVTFRSLVGEARAAAKQQQYHRAFDRYVEGLSLWSGPAGAGVAYGPAATAIFAALDDQFFAACTAAGDLAVTLRQPQRVLPALQLAAAMAPLHEPIHASLMLTLAAAGEQADALLVYREVRTRLAEDLGIDPSPTLQSAHQRVLSQTVTPSKHHPVQNDSVERSSASRSSAGSSSEAITAGYFVGRDEERAVLRHAVDRAFADSTGLALVEGEPGAGKSRLLERVAAEADRRGALVVWGNGLEGEGAPSMWPWIQAITTVIDDLGPEERRACLTDELGHLLGPDAAILTGPVPGDTGAQFRLFEQVVAVLKQASRHRPLVLLFDDLQWADDASLQMFAHVISHVPERVATIGALRDHAPTPGAELEKVLAAASRIPGHRRVRLGPFTVAEVAELIRLETGHDPSLETAQAIHARTTGNPFFTRELTRLLADGGVVAEDAAGRAEVPATVRDVVRSRIADINGERNALLETAALIGRNVELVLLARVADHDIDTTLRELEPLEALGILLPTPGDPSSFRFAHDLVRETVTSLIPSRRAMKLHLRIADALETTGPYGKFLDERLAFHLWAAGPLADPARTVAALERAGRRAVAKCALDSAERQLRLAVDVAADAGLTGLELSALSQLIAIVGMRSMYGASALDLLQRAEELAHTLGLEVEATVFLFSRWTAHAQGLALDHSRPLARRLLNQGAVSADPLVRAYGLQAWGLQQCSDGNIGEAFRHLSEASNILMARELTRDEDPVWHDLRMLVPGMLAETSAMYGDVDQARALLGLLESGMGGDPFAITVWAAHTGRIEALVGDPVRVMSATERGLAADPDFSFAFFGTYVRLARWWARAMTGQDPAGAAAEVERLIATNLLNPPRSCVATWLGLLGEIYLAAGSLDEADAALDRADRCLDTYGQRYPEGLILILRARLMHARGEPLPAVRAAAEKARSLSIEREAFLFARRADGMLAELSNAPSASE